VASNGSQANQASYEPALSANGRHVAFRSRATNLVDADATSSADIYVRDRKTGATTRVSVASDGTPGNDASQGPAISADGRHVAYVSRADNLVFDDTEGYQDAFVHDTLTGQTSRISEASDGTEGNEISWDPVLSADGRYVAFQSHADNLVDGDTNDAVDIFLRDRDTNRDGDFDEPGSVSTIRVSLTSDEEETSAWSQSPAISADGRYVAFISSGLVPENPLGSPSQVYLRDTQTGETSLVSVAPDGTPDDYGSAGPRLSADGRSVVFTTQATNLVPGPISEGYHIYLHAIETGETTLVSVASDGTPQEDWSSCQPVGVSAYGRYVAFASTAGNLVTDDKNGKWDVFLHDTETRETTRVSVGWNGTEGDWHSGDHGAALSAHARYVAFSSGAGNLVPHDATVHTDVFVRDRETAPQVKLAINYPNGAPGSTFTISGSGFPVNAPATISINGHELGTCTADAVGRFVVLLTTTGADEGLYIVTATVNPSASVGLLLDGEQPVRPQEDTGTTFAVPSGIAFTQQVFLPIVQQATS